MFYLAMVPVLILSVYLLTVLMRMEKDDVARSRETRRAYAQVLLAASQAAARKRAERGETPTDGEPGEN